MQDYKSWVYFEEQTKDGEIGEDDRRQYSDVQLLDLNEQERKERVQHVLEDVRFFCKTL